MYKYKGNISEDGYYFTILDKRYKLDLNRVKEICFVSSNQQTKENEIVELFETSEDNGTLSPYPSSKTIREIKSAGNPQNDMIIYDIIKDMLNRILNDEQEVDGYIMTTSMSFVLNTLISEKIIVEI